MRTIKTSLTVSPALTLTLCAPAQTEVAYEFARENPSDTVTPVRLEWGDFGSATSVSKFRKPGDARAYGVKWAYTINERGHTVRQPGATIGPRLSTPTPAGSPLD